MSHYRSTHSKTAKPISFAQSACTAHHGKDQRQVPPTEPLPGQVPNKSGGHVYEVSPETYTRRLLIMGTTGSTYYSSAKELSGDAVEFVVKQIEQGNGMMLLNTLKDVHESGAAPKMQFTMNLLGVLSRCKDAAVRKAALDFTIYGLRTNSQLYEWLDSHMNAAHGKGFGRGPKTVISTRYHNPTFEKHVPAHVMKTDPRKYWAGMNAMQMAYQFSKYAQRNGISMKDVASLVHFKPSKVRRHKVTKHLDSTGRTVYTNLSGTGGVTPGYVEWPLAKQTVLAWVKKGIEGAVNTALRTLNEAAPLVTKSTLMNYTLEQFTASLTGLNDETVSVLSYMWAVERVKIDTIDVSLALDLITKFNLPREVIATPLLNDERVWMALLLKDPTAEALEVNMPVTAFIRNLGTMSARGLFNVSQGAPKRREFTQRVLDSVLAQLVNKDVIVKGRVHPSSVVSAMKTYKGGKSIKGSSTWPVCHDIVRQLDRMVDIAYSGIKPTGKDELHVIDVSASMTWPDRASGIEGLLACEAASIEMLARLRAARRGEFDSRTIVGTFSTGATIVYDSDPRESAIKMNTTMTAQLDKVFTKMGISLGARTYAGVRNAPFPTHNMFDPLTCSYEDVWSHVSNQNASATDCSLPIIMALAMHFAGVASPEVIYVYTDNETNYGSVHASVAMDEYCKYVPKAKLVVIAATPTKFSIGRDGESRILNVAGLDTGASNVIYDFVTDGNTPQKGSKKDGKQDGKQGGGAKFAAEPTDDAGAEAASGAFQVEMKSSWWSW